MTAPTLTLEALGLGHLANAATAKVKSHGPANGPVLGPKHKWKPLARVIFWSHTTCLTCGKVHDRPRFSGNTIFIKGEAGTRQGRSNRYKTCIEYRPWFGGAHDLPQEIELYEDNVLHCLDCFMHIQPGSTSAQVIETLDNAAGYVRIERPHDLPEHCFWEQTDKAEIKRLDKEAESRTWSQQ